MDLHRVDKKPDWQKVEMTQWNIWQKLAATTGGIVTIGNFFSVIGLVTVAVGLWLVLKYHAGLLAGIVLALGRICDLLDGWLADKTGTKSPLGELLDATFDKIAVFGTVLALLFSGQTNSWLVLVLLIPHILVAVVAVTAYIHKRRLHVSRLGKISMAFGWIFLLLSISTISPRNDPLRSQWSFTVVIISLVMLAISVVTGLVSFSGYIRNYIQGAYPAK